MMSMPGQLTSDAEVSTLLDIHNCANRQRRDKISQVSTLKDIQNCTSQQMRDNVLDQDELGATLTENTNIENRETDKQTTTDSKSNERKCFTCSVCSKSFASAQRLKSHSVLHSRPGSLNINAHGERYSCNICSEKFKDNCSLVKHKTKHSGKFPFECDVCKKVFNYKSEMSRHMDVHTQDKPFQCDHPGCKKKFKRNYILKEHKISHLKEEPFKCDTCDKTYKQRQSLTDHIKSHFEPTFKYNRNEQFRSEKSLDKHVKVNTPILSASYQTQVLDERRYACNICFQKFIDYCSLDKHKKKHSGKFPFECYVCNKEFNCESKISLHMVVHTQDRPFQCDYPGCKKKFKRIRVLKQHMFSHLKEKPFKCDICENTYTRRQSLTVHIKSHFDPTFKYNRGRQLCSEKRLDKHVKANTPILSDSFRTQVLGEKVNHSRQCRICGEKIKGTACDFIKHVEIHSDKGRNQCNLCFKQFQSEEFLAMHLLYHEQRPQII